eukprot:474378-Pleurochrysis_carterae.AAC.1
MPARLCGRARNVSVLGAHSYSVIEFVTAGVLVFYLYFVKDKMDGIRTRIREQNLATLTAANFTVQAGEKRPK